MNISVFGLGKLGAVLAALYSNKGHNVIGVDKNDEIILKINKKISPFDEPNLQELIDNSGESLQATLDANYALDNSDISFVIVPTPSKEDGSFNNEFVLEVLRAIAKKISVKQNFHTIILSSTVLPGTCEEIFLIELEKISNKKAGIDFGFVYSPEFIALGSIVLNMSNPDLILLGATDTKSSQIAEELLKSVTSNSPVVYRMNLINAEVVKIAINTYITTKISFANMLSELCSKLPNADGEVVNDAVGGDSRIGKKYFRGAVGFGGPCFPRDNAALTFLMESKGMPAELPKATNSINSHQINRVLQIVESNFSIYEGITILGIAYKPDTPVIEGSQSLLLAEKLLRIGKKVMLHDPLALDPLINFENEYAVFERNLEVAINSSQVLIIMTPWTEYSKLSANLLNGKIIIDCWSTLKNIEHPDSKIISLGKFQESEVGKI